MHSTEQWGVASLHRQTAYQLLLAMVLHPFLPFELCSPFETLLLETLFAAALWFPLVETKGRATSLNTYNPLSLFGRPKSTTLCL